MRDNLDNPIIFIGTGRSGTTIISESIMRHKDIAFPSNYQAKYYKYPEINLIRNLFDNSIGRIQGEKQQINKVSIINKYIFKPDEAYRMWNYLTGPNINFSRDFLLNIVPNENRIKFIRNYFFKMVKYQRRKRLAIKITGPPRMSYLLSIFPDAMFVILKRKLIPTISSFLKVNFWKKRGYNQLWWTGAYTEEEIRQAEINKSDPIIMTTIQIKKIADIIDIECKKNNPRFIEISYEDFVKNPVEEINKIFTFINIKDSFSCLDNILNTNIINRNKYDEDLFPKNDLKKIYNFLESN